MLKKLLFLINLFIFLNITFLLSAEIIPIKKPIQTKEEKEQKLLIDVLKPLPKPVTKKRNQKRRKKNLRKKVVKKEKKI